MREDDAHSRDEIFSPRQMCFSRRGKLRKIFATLKSARPGENEIAVVVCRFGVLF